MLDSAIEECELADLLFQIGAVQFGEFRLKLHERNPNAPLSPFFFNLRTPENPKSGPLTPEIIVRAACLMRQRIETAHIAPYDDFTMVAGVPNAGDPFAEVFANFFRPALPVLHLVKHEENGVRRIVGVDPNRRGCVPGDGVLLFDDLITEADSKLEAIKVLREQNADVRHVVVLIDRSPANGTNRLAASNVRLHSVFTAAELFRYYFRTDQIENKMFRRSVEYMRTASSAA